MSKSNKLMALLSVWGIMLVVLGHSGFEEPAIAENLRYLHRWIYSFHMPLFFFISGYLYALTNPFFTSVRVAPFLQKKVLRLLVPYVVLGVVVFCIKYIFSGLSHADREFSVSAFLFMFIAPHTANSTIGYLWYVVTLFFIFVFVAGISAAGINLRKEKYGILLIVASWVLSAVFPHADVFNISAVLWYMPFFAFGIYYHKYELRLQPFVSADFVGGGKLACLLCCFRYLHVHAIVRSGRRISCENNIGIDWNRVLHIAV